MRRMYTLLTRCRAAKLRPEAALVGSLMGLLPEDTLTISHAESLAEVLFGKEAAPELLDLAPLDAKASLLSTAAHIALASGYALERALHHRPGLIVAFAGEADSLADARATLTLAATHKLPVVFVVQHNLAKVEKGVAPADLSHEILGVGMAGMTVDGSDAMAVYRVTQEAMFRARHEGGPTLIECKTYPKAKVPPQVRPWVQGDPVAYMEQQLRAREFWHDRLKSGI